MPLHQGDLKYVLSPHFYLDNVTNFVKEKSVVDIKSDCLGEALINI